MSIDNATPTQWDNAKDKDANIQDLEKARWYLNKLVEYYENL